MGLRVTFDLARISPHLRLPRRAGVPVWWRGVRPLHGDGTGEFSPARRGVTLAALSGGRPDAGRTSQAVFSRGRERGGATAPGREENGGFGIPEK